MQTLVFLPLRGTVMHMHMREIVIIRVYILPLPPLLFYSLRTCRDRIV